MTAGPLVAIIEDDEVFGRSLEQRFRLEGYDVIWCRKVEEAEKVLSDRSARLVISDIRLPDGTGEMLMSRVFERHGILPTIFMTAFGDIGQAVRLIKLGARDYIAKPFDLDELIMRVRTIVDPFQAVVKDGSNDPYASFGLSQATTKLRHTLEKVADRDVSVLLLGETGVGKSLAARFLHESGTRQGEPFVVVNCGSIPQSLFEATLFGHEKGAFTGATARSTGLAEQARAGTLFLDEIGEIDASMQVKLLHLIEAREFRRIGGDKPIPFNARFVFATNKNLELEVAEGRFREDLWFRINVVSSHVPPLRERKDEIGPLIDHHVQVAAERMGLVAPEISRDVFEIAQQSRWRGNVRELINRVERAVALNETGVIDVDDFWPDETSQQEYLNDTPGQTATLAGARERAERAHIKKILHLAEGRVQEAADQLGISRTTLWHKMRRYGIDSEK